MDESNAMATLLDPAKVWTFDDLDDLPDGIDRRRFEIIDGSLLVSPTPGSIHELIVAVLRDRLRSAFPSEVQLVTTLGVDIGDSYLVPDLLVATVELLASGVARVQPQDALLVIEVVSPGSRTTDRVTKPAKYAEVGIRNFWRLEAEPSVTVAAYQLRAGTYVEVGHWGAGETVELDEPFTVRFDVSDLLPNA